MRTRVPGTYASMPCRTGAAGDSSSTCGGDGGGGDGSCGTGGGDGSCGTGGGADAAPEPFFLLLRFFPIFLVFWTANLLHLLQRQLKISHPL